MSVLNLRQHLQALLCLLYAMLLAACATLPGSSAQPVKSPNDDYQYRLLTLPNRMEVLLISDPEAPKAAASLDVLVGSADSPGDRAGLAHFLEVRTDLWSLMSDQDREAAVMTKLLERDVTADDSGETKIRRTDLPIQTHPAVQEAYGPWWERMDSAAGPTTAPTGKSA